MKIEDILKVELQEADAEKWGEWPIRTIKRNFELTPSGLPQIKEFLLDHMDYLDKAIEYKGKWAGKVYHENVSLSKGFELKVVQQLLVNINRFQKS